MKIVLSILLGVYSVAMGTYALSEFYSATGCSVDCFKGESAFPGGANSTSTSKRVNVKYSTSGAEAFPSQHHTKVANALGGAMGDWNSATADGSGTGYNFHSAQNEAGTKADVEVVYVDKLPNTPSGKEVCMRMTTTKSANGAIEKGTLYISRKVVENSSEQDLKELIEHELGHFIGLADYYGDATRCSTVMGQAKEGCTTGLSGSSSVQDKDVRKVREYAGGTGNCKGDRKPANVAGGGGGFIDPNPSPIFYPRTCYFFYDAIDVYVACIDCRGGYRYVGTVYYLTDVWCT